MDNRLFKVTSLPADYVDAIAINDGDILNCSDSCFVATIYEAFMLKLGLLEQKSACYEEAGAFTIPEINDCVPGVYEINILFSCYNFEELIRTTAFTWSIEVLIYVCFFFEKILEWKYATLLHLNERRRMKYVNAFQKEYLEHFNGFEFEDFEEYVYFSRNVILHAEVIAYIAAGEYDTQSCARVLSLIDESDGSSKYLSSRQYFDEIINKMKYHSGIRNDEVFHHLFLCFFSMFFSVDENRDATMYTIEYGDDVVEFLLRKKMGEFEGRRDNIFLTVNSCVDRLLRFFEMPGITLTSDGDYYVSALFYEDNMECVEHSVPVFAEVFKRLYPLL